MTKATVTSKGQVTIPKSIRERANIKSGTELDFQYEEGHLTARPLTKKLSSIKGIVKSKKRSPVSLDEMKKAVLESVKKRFK